MTLALLEKTSKNKSRNDNTPSQANPQRPQKISSGRGKEGVGEGVGG